MPPTRRRSDGGANAQSRPPALAQTPRRPRRHGSGGGKRSPATAARPPRRRRAPAGSVALLAALSLGSALLRRPASGLAIPVGAGEGEPRSLPSPQPPPTATATTASLDVYLRLSPLVGGPRFLPLHVEVMLLGDGGPPPTGDEAGGGPDGAATRRRRGTGTTTTTRRTRRTLHRFDFLPESPTDPATLARLATLRSVPGLARHRTLPRRGGGGLGDEGGGASEEEEEAADLLSVDRILEGGKNGLTFRLGSVAPMDPSGASYDSRFAAVTSAVRFTERYQEERGELNLISNGCHTFAFELLSHLGSFAETDGEGDSDGFTNIFRLTSQRRN